MPLFGGVGFSCFGIGLLYLFVSDLARATLIKLNRHQQCPYLDSSRGIKHYQPLMSSEGAAVMSSQLLIGTALIIVNAVFHVSCLVWLAGLIKRIGTTTTFDPNRKGMILLLGIAVLGLIAIHTTSAWAWAAVYLSLGEFTELSKALYFSVVTSTTLGYGDITLSERWQLLASFEAMVGFVLFGASTAFLLGVTKSWFSHLAEPDS